MGVEEYYEEETNSAEDEDRDEGKTKTTNGKIKNAMAPIWSLEQENIKIKKKLEHPQNPK